jgi:hypothetical protein
LWSGQAAYFESEKFLENDFLFLSQLLKPCELLAKHKTAGIKNNHPGSTGSKRPINPIIKKTIPKVR